MLHISKNKLSTFALLIVSILSVGCADNDTIQLQTDNLKQNDPEESWSRWRTVDEAAELACKAVGMLPAESRAGSSRTFDKSKAQVVGSKSTSRTSNADTLMYVFNFDDNLGYALIAADKAVDGGVIAVTESGSFDVDVEPENPGLAIYIDNVIDYLVTYSGIPGIGNDRDPREDGDKGELFLKEHGDLYYDGGISTGHSKIDTTILYKETIEPNYNLKWGQRDPEGRYAPNGVAGCVNTAALMALSYIDKPFTLPLTYCDSIAPQGKEIYLDWNEIRAHTQSGGWCYRCNNPNPDYDVHEAMAQFCREFGHRNHSEYHMGSSTISPSTGTHLEPLVKTLRDLGFNASDINEFTTFDPLYTLRAKGAVIVGGTLKSRTASHCWIIDGIKYWKEKYSYYTCDPNGPWILSKEQYGEFYYTHINWGWDGMDNGFFKSYTYNPQDAYEYDPGIWHTNTQEFNVNIVYFTITRE